MATEFRMDSLGQSWRLISRHQDSAAPRRESCHKHINCHLTCDDGSDF